MAERPADFFGRMHLTAPGDAHQWPNLIISLTQQLLLPPNRLSQPSPPHSSHDAGQQTPLLPCEPTRPFAHRALEEMVHAVSYAVRHTRLLRTIAGMQHRVIPPGRCEQPDPSHVPHDLGQHTDVDPRPAKFFLQPTSPCEQISLRPPRSLALALEP